MSGLEKQFSSCVKFLASIRPLAEYDELERRQINHRHRVVVGKSRKTDTFLTRIYSYESRKSFFCTVTRTTFLFRSCLADRFIPAGDSYVNWQPWSSPSLDPPPLVRGPDWGDEGNKDQPKPKRTPFESGRKKTYKTEAGDVVRPGPPWSAGVRGGIRPLSAVRVDLVRVVRLYL